MKKKVKQKYQSIKPDGRSYTELVSEYEREEMPDYSFKSKTQAMGKNAKKLRTGRIIKTVLSVIGAIAVVYTGYFIVALIKGVNARPQTSTTQYVVVTGQESTTVPAELESTTSLTTTTEKADKKDTNKKSDKENDDKNDDTDEDKENDKDESNTVAEDSNT